MSEDIYLEVNGLVYKIARSFTSDKTLIEDLYQQGMIGVLKAKKNYKPELGVDFKAYAKMYIYGEMHDYYNNANKTFKTNKNVINMYKLISKTSELLTQEYKRKPTTTEVANYLNISEYDIENTINIMQSTLSINYDYDESSLEEYIGHSDSYLGVELKMLLNNLSPTEKQIILYKYLEGYSQNEIAKIMNISQSSVSRCEHSGISRIRREHLNSISIQK